MYDFQHFKLSDTSETLLVTLYLRAMGAVNQTGSMRLHSFEITLMIEESKASTSTI